VREPLAVLEEILGHPGPTKLSATGDGSLALQPEHLVEEVDFGVLSLQDFLDHGLETEKPTQMSTQMVEECEYV